MTLADLDSAVRAAAFGWLDEQTRQRGEVLPHTVLMEGFQIAGRRVPLLGPQGIVKPAILPAVALSITTVPVVEGRERRTRMRSGPTGC